MALFSSVLIFYPIFIKKNKISVSKNIKILLIINMIFLTWLGGCPVEAPFVLVRQIISGIYFFFIILIFVNIINIDSINFLLF
jgi:quinol-cytochrome oxidoreductase complex cytochrome b subunit